jgi:protease secretion system membrane fusion protein
MAQEDASKRGSASPLAGAAAAEDIDFVTAAPATATGRAARIGRWALVLGLLGFVAWAAFAPLDEGVPGAGVVSIDTKRKAVQHLTGGIVKQVLVGEGDQVKEGQLLVRLDEAVAKANFETVRQRYLGLRAMEGRLRSEQLGLPKIVFSAELLKAAQDPQIRQLLQTQEQLFGSRRASLHADVQGIEESILGQEASIKAYEGMSVSRRQQQVLLQEELTNARGLVSEGYLPRNRQLELERAAADINVSLADLQGNTVRARRAIDELRQRSIVRQQDYRKDVETLLADVSREVQADASKLVAAQDELGRMDIKSPAAGQVVALAFQTVGGVIGPGQKLMDVVPLDQALLIEARVAPHMIDRVQAGLPVDVRFSSFAHSPQLVVDGQVVSVSGDLLVDPQSGVGYFLARVGVTAEGYKKLGKRLLQAGMPVEVVFRTGERSLLTYLLHPLTKRLAASLKEE